MRAPDHDRGPAFTLDPVPQAKLAISDGSGIRDGVLARTRLPSDLAKGRREQKSQGYHEGRPLPHAKDVSDRSHRDRTFSQ